MNKGPFELMEIFNNKYDLNKFIFLPYNKAILNLNCISHISFHEEEIIPGYVVVFNMKNEEKINLRVNSKEHAMSFIEELHTNLLLSDGFNVLKISPVKNQEN